MDYIDTVAELKKVHGIENIHVYGFDDLTYEVTFASFSIKNRPEAEFRVLSAQDGLIGKPDHLWIRQVGPWQFHETSYVIMGVTDLSGKPIKTSGLRDFLDLGAAGPCNALLPCTIKDMNDVVAHYDELVRHFATWSDDQSWGESKPVDGPKAVYCVCPAGQPRPNPPAKFP